MLFKHSSSTAAFLIVGLGNPGPEYQFHRHNVGFMVGEELRRRGHLPVLRSRFHGLAGEGVIGGQRVALLLPMTFMNRSGSPVSEALGHYRLKVERLLVIHDEVELPFGEVKLKSGGGLGGHNGLRSLERSLGSRDFWRLRVGVGRPVSGTDSLADYVLEPFHESREEVLLVTALAADLTEAWLEAGGSMPGEPGDGPSCPA